MKSAIAVLTYRRLHVSDEELKGLAQHCSNYPIAVFEDMGQRDGSSRFLSHGRVAKPRPDLMATEMVMNDEAVQAALSEEERLLGVRPKIPRFFVGEKNLGVSGNSNRAIRWFLEETDADHLYLLNDDLHILGDFVSVEHQVCESCGLPTDLVDFGVVIMDCGGCTQVYREGGFTDGDPLGANACTTRSQSVSLTLTASDLDCIDVYAYVGSGEADDGGSFTQSSDQVRICRCDRATDTCTTCVDGACD